ncbi:MAG: glycosyltransferase [Bacteroidetes bacterium]|nr:glycosyltransferase [Bacteroidota bacterium]MCH8525016.1 glycosyltransferase [Balneolales bacterium]
MSTTRNQQSSGTDPIASAWITWERQTRNRSMANILGVPLYELLSDKKRVFRYIELIRETFRIIRREKIQVLFVQNPSIVLALSTVLGKKWFNYTLVVDAHNAGVYPLEGKSRILNAITSYIIRAANLTIVTNTTLANIVEQRGGRAFVMPDPIPDLTPKDIIPATTESHESRYVLFISTWAEDEPYMEVIEAARQLDTPITVCITGNYRKKLSEHDIHALPDNVKLLGFLDEADYVQWLAGSALTIDLTTRDNCLVCGAYESISLGVPAILSDFPINREIFNTGVVYSANTASEIKKSIQNGMQMLPTLRKDVQSLKSSMIQEEKLRAEALRNKLGIS